MKLSILLFLICTWAFGQQSDASLTTQVDTDIRNKTTASSITKTNVADAFQSVIDSKVSILAPRLTTSSTAGYVWTASGTTGLGSWAVSGGITNSAANNELMKSNGTNAVASGLFSSSAGTYETASGVALILGGTGSANASLQGGSSGGSVSLSAYGPFGGAGTGVVQAAYNGSGFTNSIPRLRISNQTTGTATVGAGFGIMFHTRTGVTNLEEVAFIDAVTTDVTAGNEDADLVFKTMAAGATADEKFRISSTGIVDHYNSNYYGYRIGSDVVAATRTNNIAKVGGTSVPHYTSSEEPLGMIWASSGASDSYVVIGGGEGTLNAATDIRIFTAANTTTASGSERLRIDRSGNVGIGTSTFGTNAATVLAIANGTVPTTSPANSVQLYSEDVAASAELKVRDEATNITTLSPHNFSLIGKPSEPGAFSHYSEYTNPETGEREAINIDMVKLARLVEQLTGEKLVYKTTLKDKK